jgi:predicted enzyme related to lactoylglutathione lyase
MNAPAAGPSLFKDVAFVIYPVTDVKKARAFYEEKLGLKVTANWDDQWVEYDIGHGTLAITTADATHKAGIHGPTIGLEVVDFDVVLEHLKKEAMAIATGPFDSPACRGCIIRDPDGNEIILHAKK